MESDDERRGEVVGVAGREMAATIYLHDGRRCVLVEASAVVVEVALTPSGLHRVLVCRDATGRAVAEFAAEAVLAFRRSQQRDAAPVVPPRAAARVWAEGR